jgi:predicted nicotinamide N-methyase
LLATKKIGTRVWHAAIRAIEYLSLHQSEKTIRSSSLLELGCGLGVPGMIYHLLGGSVILTDQESIMSQLNKNVQENFPDSIITPEKGVQFGSVGSTIQALPLTWSREGVKQLLVDTDLEEQGVDICLNCDCVYEPLYGESWKALVEVMDEMLRVNPKCLMLTSCERRNADGIPNFLEAMQQSSHVSQVDLVHFDSVNNIELYITRGHTVS